MVSPVIFVGQPPHDLVEDPALNVQPGAGDAALALRGEGPGGGSGHDLVQVRVVEHDVG